MRVYNFQVYLILAIHFFLALHYVEKDLCKAIKKCSEANANL